MSEIKFIKRRIADYNSTDLIFFDTYNLNNVVFISVVEIWKYNTAITDESPARYSPNRELFADTSEDNLILKSENWLKEKLEENSIQWRN